MAMEDPLNGGFSIATLTESAKIWDVSKAWFPLRL